MDDPKSLAVSSHHSYIDYLLNILTCSLPSTTDSIYLENKNTKKKINKQKTYWREKEQHDDLTKRHRLHTITTHRISNRTPHYHTPWQLSKRRAEQTN